MLVGRLELDCDRVRLEERNLLFLLVLGQVVQGDEPAVAADPPPERPDAAEDHQKAGDALRPADRGCGRTSPAGPRGFSTSSGRGSATAPLRSPATIVICSPSASGRVAVNVASSGVNRASQGSLDPAGPWKHPARSMAPPGAVTTTDSGGHLHRPGARDVPVEFVVIGEDRSARRRSGRRCDRSAFPDTVRSGSPIRNRWMAPSVVVRTGCRRPSAEVTSDQARSCTCGCACRRSRTGRRDRGRCRAAPVLGNRHRGPRAPRSIRPRWISSLMSNRSMTQPSSAATTDTRSTATASVRSRLRAVVTDPPTGRRKANGMPGRPPL